MPDLFLASERILITGGTGKIGTVLVKTLSDIGYTVIFTSRSQDKIDKVIANLSCNNVIGIPIDLEVQGSTALLLNSLIERKLLPQVLINNARRLDNLKPTGSGGPSEAQWQDEYKLSVIVPYELSMALANHSESCLKNVINISSMYGIVPFNPTLYTNPDVQAPIHYSVAKAAQIHLTKELGIRLSSKGIAVNSISYGGIEGRVNEEFLKRYSELCPMGRMLREEEVAGAVTFLISAQSCGIIGHNLVVDGGWSVW